MTAPDCDVLVIGLGPAGAATGIRLARQGFRVVAIDRARFPRDKACSEYLSPEGVRHLAALGVLEAIERRGGRRIRGTTVVAPRGSRLTGLFAKAGQPFRATGLSVTRRLLDTELVNAARAAGVAVHEGTAAAELLREGGRVTGGVLRNDAGQLKVRARLTVGADGLRSLVARELGAVRREPIRRWAFVAHVSGVDGLSDTAELHVRGDGYVGLNPVGGGAANISLVVPQSAASAARGDAEGFLFAGLDRFEGVRDRVSRGGLLDRVLVTGPFALRAARVAGDGALLVGDAADFFDPFTGEGICAALRGAELVEAAVSPALRNGGPVGAAALAGYPELRRRAFLGKWAVERLIGYGMLVPALFDRAVARLERRGLSHTMIGVTGDFVPARAVLNPAFLARMVL
ncbi:MAG: NAD(P)/FAD-dependent oxidoreductase [Gemmatimonadales bacterium]